MKKKLTAIFLCVALVAIAIVGASLAYFTDTKSATNTFTVGNVKIDLIESGSTARVTTTPAIPPSPIPPRPQAA